MKTRARYLFFVIAVLCCRPSAFCQQHLDIAFEGPWLFYQEPAFAVDNSGAKSAALIAIAPFVLGHLPATFSTGDGFPFDPGVYCVGFDGACSLTNLLSMGSGDYPPHGLLPVNKPAGWDWRTTKSAYVLILPIPNSSSADGQYQVTLHKTFPTLQAPSQPTSHGSYALGLHLHYPKGPQTVSLFSCTGPPTAATCNSPQGGKSLTNSGTLRITIKSDESPATIDDCDYHGRRAYHTMIHLLDDSLSANGQNAFINVPTFDSCARCDPQQDMIPSDCPGVGIMTITFYPGADYVSGRLTDLVNFLKKLGFPKDQVGLSELSDQAKVLTGKSPALSQMQQLKLNLKASTDALNAMLEIKIRAHNMASTAAPRPEDLRAALEKESVLNRALDEVIYSGTSGKDCRAAEMLIQ
jgi:hypothetical protein